MIIMEVKLFKKYFRGAQKWFLVRRMIAGISIRSRLLSDCAAIVSKYRDHTSTLLSAGSMTGNCIEAKFIRGFLLVSLDPLLYQHQ